MYAAEKGWRNGGLGSRQLRLLLLLVVILRVTAYCVFCGDGEVCLVCCYYVACGWWIRCKKRHP